MFVRVKEGRVIIELSLSLPKRSWKIRTKFRRGRRGRWVEALGYYVFTPRVGDVIMEGDAFEWMITNEEIRDILLALKHVSPDEYEAIKEDVEDVRPSDYINWQEVKGPLRVELDETGIIVEACLRGKQRKPEEPTPHFFLVFPLDRPSRAHFIMDMWGNVVREPVGHKITAGDRLVWEILDNRWIKEVTVLIARLSEAHNSRMKEEVLRVIESL